MKKYKALKDLSPHLNPRHYELLHQWYQAQVITDPEERKRKTADIQSKKVTWEIVSRLLTENPRILVTAESGEQRNLQVNATLHLNVARDLAKRFRDKLQSKDKSPFQKIELAQKLILVHHQSIKEDYYEDALLSNLKVVYYQDLKLALKILTEILQNNAEGDYLCRSLYTLDHTEALSLSKNLNQFYDFYVAYLKEKITNSSLPIRDDLLFTFSEFQHLAYFFNDLEVFQKIETELATMKLEELISEKYLTNASQNHQAAIANHHTLEQHKNFKHLKAALINFVDSLSMEEKPISKKENASDDQTTILIQLKKEIKNITDIEKNINTLLDILQTLKIKNISEAELLHFNNLIKTISVLMESSQNNCHSGKEITPILFEIHHFFYQKVSSLKAIKEKRAHHAALKKAKLESKAEQVFIENSPSEISKPEKNKKEEETSQPQPVKVKANQKSNTKKKKKRHRGKKSNKSNPTTQPQITERFDNITDNPVLSEPSIQEDTKTSDNSDEEQPSIINEPILVNIIDPYAQDEAFLYPTDEINIPPAIKAVMGLVTDEGYRAYIVGGYPRDILSNSADISNDIDLIVELTHDEIMTCCAVYNPQPGPFEGLYTIDIDGVKTDIISVPKGFLLKENAEKRDFPFNAIFLDPKGRCYAPLKKTWDYLSNIANPQFELISDNPYELFKQNPICMLRVIDFSTRLKQYIPDMLQKAIQQCGVHLRDLPFKAFKSHFIKLFYKQNALNNFFNMMRTQLFHHIFKGLDINYQIDCKQKSPIREYMVAQLKNWDHSTDLKPFSALFSIFFFPSLVRKVGKVNPDRSRDLVVTTMTINEHTEFLEELAKDFASYPLNEHVKVSLAQHLTYYDQFVEYSIQKQNALNHHQRSRANRPPQLGDYIKGAAKGSPLK